MIQKSDGESASVSHLSNQLLRIPFGEVIYARGMRRLLSRHECRGAGSLPSFEWERLDMVILLRTALLVPLEVPSYDDEVMWEHFG